MSTIGMACNIFEEANAIHGLLESASQFFDEMFFYHTGPGGKHSQDGTIEILEKWGVRVEFGNMDEGFGKIRSDLIDKSRCEWVMILDADERFYPRVPAIAIEGTEKYPEVERPDLKTTITGWIDQGDWMRELISQDWDVIRTCRRHWFDHTWTRPCQNWHMVADWQARTIRRNGKARFKKHPPMHEQLIGFNKMWEGPAQGDGPYHDHFHCWYKPMEPEQRKADIAYFDALHHGSVHPDACHET